MNTRWQFVRYATVGFSSNALLYVAYLLVTSLGAGHKTAMTLLYAVGVLLTFQFNRSWTFNHHGHVSGTFIRYVIVYGVLYLFNLGVLYMLVDKYEFPHQAVQGILIIVIAIIIFTIQKFWIFTNNETQQANDYQA